MFKSIQWKLVFIFTLVILAVIVVAGVYFKSAITDFYLRDFNSRMSKVFSSTELTRQFSEAVESDNSVEKIGNIVNLYSWQFGIDMYRNVFLLNQTGKVVYSSNENLIEGFEITPNIISALNNNIGTDVTLMDYAYPLLKGTGEVAYIVYVKDTKEELNAITNNITGIIFNAMGVGIIIAVIIGFFMARTITTPIISLTQKAKQIAGGDFEARIKVSSSDEIGKLGATFNNMSRELQYNLGVIEGEKTKLETILLYMSDGVMAFDSDGRIMHINNAAKRIFEKENYENINFDSFFSEIGIKISMQELIFKKNEIIERKFEISDKHIKTFFATSLNEGGRIDSIVVVLHDITEQQKLEKARREFVANVSHELRTPITTVKSYSETMLETEDLPPNMQREFLEIICKESDRMTRLVRDLLLLSRLDYGKDSTYVTEEFNIAEMIQDIIRKLSIAYSEREHKLEFISSSEIPLITGVRDRIEQVLINLITNAIKYTPDKGVISVYADTKYGNIIITIKDNGIGIPQGDIEHIFERFYRVDKARSRESGGTGLGLAIAKEIIEDHKGKISIKSKQGEGTEVKISIPIKKKEADM